MNKDLIERYLSGTLDEGQVKELLNWVNTSEANKSYFARMKNLWAATRLETKNTDIDVDEAYRLFHYRMKKGSAPEKENSRGHIRKLSVNPAIRKVMQVAAVLVFLYSIALSYYYLAAKSKITYTEITTHRGEKSYLKLADGTQIWINSETTLRYPSRLDTKNVEVYLDGEAYFNVTKNPKRTFIVNASDLNIAVLGTSFNVKSYSTDNTIEATLEEGKISITGQMGNKKINKPLILIPNQQATFIKDSKQYAIEEISEPLGEEKPVAGSEIAEQKPLKDPKIIHSEEVDAALYTSWKDGKLVFKSETFGELSLQMERWYDVKINITDPELKIIKYTGVFEKETIEQALQALSLSLPFRYSISQNEITITKANS